MLPHALTWRGGFGDETIANPAAAQHALLYDPNAPRSYGVFSNELQKKDAGTAKNGPVTSSGQYTFAGIEDGYFAGVFLPAGASSIELTTFSDQIPKDGKDVPQVGAAVGGEGLNSFELYVGPKDLEILKRVNPKLELVVDWGKFAIIAKPLFEALKWTAEHVGGNYGWAIILVTIAINTVLFPLKITSMKSSKKMQSIQPQIAAINAKYKGLSLNDPKKADQNAEIMALYKENGVNPAGGCLPMMLQLPFFFAFYAVLGVAIQLRGAHWLWVTRSFAAGIAADSRAADDPDGDAVPDAKDDAEPGHGSVAAEDDDGDAAGAGVHVLLCVVRAGNILVDRKRGGHRSAVVFESGHT